MLKVFNAIMLSNPLEDEARFRGYIDEAIKEGRVEEHKPYTKETAKSKNKRLKAAGREARLAEEHAKLLGLKVDDVKEVGRKGAPVPAQEDLAALIQQRQKGRAEGFLEGLEAKYAKKEVEKKAKGKGKKRKVEEEGMPDEEAFQAAAKRLKKREEGEDRDKLGKAKNEKRKGAKKARANTPDDDDDDDDDDDKHGESDGESLGSDSLEEEDVDVEEQEEASAGSDEDSFAASEEEEDAMDTTPVTASSPARPTTSTRQSNIRPSSTANAYAPFNNKNFSSNHPSFKPPKKKPVVNREKARAAKEAKNAEKERMKRTLRGLGALEETAKEKRRKKALGRMGR